MFMKKCSNIINNKVYTYLNLKEIYRMVIINTSFKSISFNIDGMLILGEFMYHGLFLISMTFRDLVSLRGVKTLSSCSLSLQATRSLTLIFSRLFFNRLVGQVLFWSDERLVLLSLDRPIFFIGVGSCFRAQITFSHPQNLFLYPSVLCYNVHVFEGSRKEVEGGIR